MRDDLLPIDYNLSGTQVQSIGRLSGLETRAHDGDMALAQAPFPFASFPRALSQTGFPSRRLFVTVHCSLFGGQLCDHEHEEETFHC